MNRYTSFIGYTCKDDLTGAVIGIITDVVADDGKFWFTLDDEYQVEAAGSEEVINLSNGETFIRVK